MQVNNFLERYRQGERHFTHIDLSGANLTGASLRDIDLSGANLSGANLSWADLSHANLAEACLHQTNLHSAILNKTNFDRATLNRVTLTKADLRWATFRDAELNWADLSLSDLSGADLQRVRLNQINLEQAQLNNALLMDAILMEANLRHASLISANLTGASLQEANLEQANLRDAILVSTNLTEANLKAAYLRGSNLSDANCHRAILMSADMSEANCECTDFSRANLTGAYLLKACLRKADLLRAILQDVYLLRTDLSEANLRGADLRRADLSGAYLKDTLLNEANLSDAFLIESYLIQTNVTGAELTGCCIHSWHLEDVDLSRVQCKYIFTGFDYTSQKPSDRYPAKGELSPGALGHKNSDERLIIDVWFREAPNWEVLVFTLTQVELECPNIQLTLKSYEFKFEQYLLHLSVNRLVNTQIISQRILQLYPKLLERFVICRPIFLDLLNIQENRHLAIELVSQTSLPNSPSLSLTDRTVKYSHVQRKRRMYQEVVTQIQRILLSQTLDQCVKSVERLLEFLKQQKISTEEIQKQVISQVIIKRAANDPIFQKQLLQWEETADEAVRFSAVGQGVRLAITLIWSSAKPLK
jgi:uncharacterized protein YjbI with pentapeptide repeats